MKLLLAVNRWSLPILLVYLISLTIGSLGNVSAVPSLGFSFDDKIYHFLAYAVLTALLFNYLLTINLKSKIVISAVFAIIYGIIIEALQAILTDFRTPDYYDALANMLGALVVMILLFSLKDKLKLN